MCGRFTLTTSPKDLAEYFDVPEQLPFELRYNIAPSQDVAVIREQDDERQLAMLRWGLVPHWSKDVKIGYKMINARAETVASKPAFRAALRARRCIIPASGFFEWLKKDKTKQPYYLFRKDGHPMALAGLWERWENPDKPGEIIESCTIITTESNSLVAKLHNRMPAILEPDSFAPWLDPQQQNPTDLLPLLHPASEDVLDLYPVSDYVNKPANEGKECIDQATDKKA